MTRSLTSIILGGVLAASIMGLGLSVAHLGSSTARLAKINQEAFYAVPRGVSYRTASEGQ